MPVTKVKSGWSSGNLVFFESAVGRSTTGDILTIGTTMVSVGNTAQDVDFKVFLGASDQYALFDAGAASVTLAGASLTVSGDATTGVGQVYMGTLSAAQTLNANPGATVVPDVMNILHSAGAGDCDDLVGRYTKVAVSGDGDSGLTVVGTAQRVYVGTADDDSAAQEAYAIQPWAKHSGTGTLLAMSGVSAALILNDGDAFEATNSINAGHFHIKTASGQANGAVTSSNFDGVMVEVYGNVTGLDSVLHLYNNGTSTDSIIKATGGSASYFASFSGSTFVETGDVTSGKSCTGGLRCYNIDGTAVGVIPFYAD